MANALNDENIIGITNTELKALRELLDKQENLDPRLNDFNNTVQAL